MNPISLSLKNLQPGANLVRVGIPFPKGSVTDCVTLSLVDNHNAVHSENPTTDRSSKEISTIQSRINPTAYWADGSIKWGLAKIAIQNSATSTREMQLLSGPPAERKVLVELIKQRDTAIVVKSSAATFCWKKDTVFPEIKFAGKTLWQSDTCTAQLQLENSTLCDFQITDVTVPESDDLSLKLQIAGIYIINSKQHLNAKFVFEVLPDANLSLLCELHNPHRALHPGGIWDLGDPGSIMFNDFSLTMKKSVQDTTHLLLEPEDKWIPTTQPMVLFQASSGGTHWNNAVHNNAKGEVCNKFRGYQLTSGEQLLQAGRRASPVLKVESNGTVYTMQNPYFWQNFPKSIDINKDEISLGLFPKHHGDAYELQGGERKRHELNFDFTPSINKYTTPHHTTKPYAKVSAKAYKEAGVFRYFDDQLSCDKYDTLITPAKNNTTGFYAKREQLDEYGWRNFGEIYADHEAAYHVEIDRPYVSHYNNQYDAVYGFIRQFALTGDHFWLPLLIDLANHTMDIDIYRTEEDRLEYNNGYFWHTDHYVEAETATHRTYSAVQINSEGVAQSGGGPSSGHCYSTGLTYYYFMTGDEDAKNTVTCLGNWIINYQEGSGTLLETARKILQEDTANFIKTCKGKKVLKYRYPMDRETGNYIRTLMDCFDLSADITWLEKVEEIITSTAGPQDDISAREFESVEYTWFYIVFLQEVVRYLDLKRILNQYDSNFYRARAILLHYARWMVENERPYLHSAENLEYPNATWIAQETRRVAVLYAAYKYALKDRAEFLERARYFRDYLVKELSQADTLHYARIQILLLQNHGPSALIDTDSLPYPGIRDVKVADQDSCFYTPATHFRHIAGKLASSLLKFRISNELRWLRTRTG